MQHDISNITHHPYYSRWKTMVKMCSNPNNKFYQIYGGNGVKVDWEWASVNPEGSRNFITWIEEELLKNPLIDPFNFLVVRNKFNGSFSPDNCHVADRSDVNRSRKRLKELIANSAQLRVAA